MTRRDLHNFDMPDEEWKPFKRTAKDEFGSAAQAIRTLIRRYMKKKEEA